MSPVAGWGKQVGVHPSPRGEEEERWGCAPAYTLGPRRAAEEKGGAAPQPTDREGERDLCGPVGGARIRPAGGEREGKGRA